MTSTLFSPRHSFVTDPWDQTYERKGAFTNGEIEEMKNCNLKEKPLISEDTLKYLNQWKEVKKKAVLDSTVSKVH